MPLIPFKRNYNMSDASLMQFGDSVAGLVLKFNTLGVTVETVDANEILIDEFKTIASEYVGAGTVAET